MELPTRNVCGGSRRGIRDRTDPKQGEVRVYVPVGTWWERQTCVLEPYSTPLPKTPINIPPSLWQDLWVTVDYILHRQLRRNALYFWSFLFSVLLSVGLVIHDYTKIVWAICTLLVLDVMILITFEVCVPADHEEELHQAMDMFRPKFFEFGYKLEYEREWDSDGWFRNFSRFISICRKGAVA